MNSFISNLLIVDPNNVGKGIIFHQNVVSWSVMVKVKTSIGSLSMTCSTQKFLLCSCVYTNFTEEGEIVRPKMHAAEIEDEVDAEEEEEDIEDEEENEEEEEEEEEDLEDEQVIMLNCHCAVFVGRCTPCIAV